MFLKIYGILIKLHGNYGKLMKDILILGEGGFIGRNLKEFLSEYKESYNISTPTIGELDISDEQAVKAYLQKQYFDVIIHAAVFNPRIENYAAASKELEKNLRMYFNFERYQQLFGKMLYFGSGAEFDKREEISSICEGDTGNGIPLNDYGFYKYIINRSIRYSKNIYNLRIFGLFGKYENWRKTFISGACCKALKGLPITIKQNVFFDYLYIDDFCRIIKWFIENDQKYKDYNITSGKRIDLITLADIVKKVSNKEVPVYVCNVGLAKEYSASNQRLIDEIKHFEFTPIENAIRNLYDWYSNNEKIIDLESLLYQ